MRPHRATFPDKELQCEREHGGTPQNRFDSCRFHFYNNLLIQDDAIVILSKSAQKTINKVDKPTAIKLKKAFINIDNGKGCIEPFKPINKRRNTDNLYRYKMDHYRIIFKKTVDDCIIQSITTKTNTKFRRTGCK